MEGFGSVEVSKRAKSLTFVETPFAMLSVRAIFDGQTLKLLEEVPLHGPQQVIVTFLETAETEFSASELHQLAQHGGGLSFLHDEAEDVYTDADLKEKF